MKDYIELKKCGCFYNVYNEDCYILFYFFKYKINNNKTGFHVKNINKILNKLDFYKVNYIINNQKHDFNKLNTYNHYKELGKIKYYEYLTLKDIENKILKLDDKKLKKIYDLLKEEI